MELAHTVQLGKVSSTSSTLRRSFVVRHRIQLSVAVVVGGVARTIAEGTLGGRISFADAGHEASAHLWSSRAVSVGSPVVSVPFGHGIHYCGRSVGFVGVVVDC